MEILPSYSQFLFSLLLYVMNNKHWFTKNFEAITTALDLLIIFIYPLLI